MGEFASKGVAGAGLGTGIAGLALGVMNSGAGLLGMGRNGGFGWGNGFGWNGWNGGACGGNWNGFGWNGAQFDMGVSEALAERDARIAQLEANKYSDESDLTLYKYFDGKIKEINDKLCEQAVFNATLTGGVGGITQQIAELRSALGGITQTVVPQRVICNTNNCGNMTVV